MISRKELNIFLLYFPQFEKHGQNWFWIKQITYGTNIKNQ